MYVLHVYVCMREREEGSDHAATIKSSLLQKVPVSEIVLFLECVCYRNYITKCLSEVCILYYLIMLFDDYASWPQLKAASPNLSSVSVKGVTYGEVTPDQSRQSGYPFGVMFII